MRKASSLAFLGLLSLLFSLLFSTPVQARIVTEQERADMESLIFFDDGTMHQIEGLEDANPALFEFGDTVPIYQHLTDGSINQSMEYIPLMYEGRYVAGFYKICEGQYTFLTGMANVLQEYRDKTGADEVAVIFDANGMNITDGCDLSLYGPPEDLELAESVLTYESLNIDELSELDLGDALDTVSVHDKDQQKALQRSTNTGSMGGTRTQGTEHRLAVQPVMQPYGTKICWAACMSMVYGLATGTYYIASDVAVYYHFLFDPNPFNTSFDVTRNGEWIACALKNCCNLGNYQFHDVMPIQFLSFFAGINDTMLTSYINAGYPIIGGMYRYYSDNTPVLNVDSHVVVFDGYLSDGRALVHDPWPTTGDVIATYYYNSFYGINIYCYYLPDSSTGTPEYMTNLSHIKKE